MPFPSRQAAVVGVYTTDQGKLPDSTSFSLQLEAIKGGMEDAGLALEAIDGVVPMSYTSHLEDTPPAMFWAEQLGERPLTLMEMGQAQGGVAKAAAAIAAGMCEVVVVFYGRSGSRDGPSGWLGRPVKPGGGALTTAAEEEPEDLAPRVAEFGFEQAGAFMTTWYALWARRYMHEFGVTSEDLAHVAVSNRYHATLKPDSIMGKRGEITVDDVLESPFICEPLHRLDCSLDNDGGYAIVVASAAVARGCRSTPVWILGGAESTFTDFYATVPDPWFPEEGASVRRTADLAFEMAGVSRDEIDVAGLYDCFTITAVRNLEEMGFCKLGEGADFYKEGHARLGGKMPVSTDGGLLSNSHNGDVSGMPLIEVVRQLRGGLGARQVPNAKLGASLGQGWHIHGQASTVILASD
jgi:acetyl-CoA acetyltransferase